jgi:hypothetical protein
MRALRRAADAGAKGRPYGIYDFHTPPRLWRVLRGGTGTGLYPWPSDEPRGSPVLVHSSTGTVRCWPPAPMARVARIGWGETGNPDGDTFDG